MENKFIKFFTWVAFIALFPPLANAMTLKEIMSPDFRLREAALGNFIVNQIHAVASADDVINIYQTNLDSLQQSLEKEKLSDQERMEIAKEMLAESAAALSQLTKINSPSKEEYGQLFYATSCLAAAYLGASGEAITKNLVDMTLVPVNIYITKFLDENTFLYEDSSNGLESGLEVELIPQMNLALVHFTQADNNRATFDRWDGICGYNMQKDEIICRSNQEADIKFEFILKIGNDELTTLKNNNFDEFVRDGSRSVVTLPEKFRRKR